MLKGNLKGVELEEVHCGNSGKGLGLVGHDYTHNPTAQVGATREDTAII